MQKKEEEKEEKETGKMKMRVDENKVDFVEKKEREKGDEKKQEGTVSDFVCLQ